MAADFNFTFHVVTPQPAEFAEHKSPVPAGPPEILQLDATPKRRWRGEITACDADTYNAINMHYEAAKGSGQPFLWKTPPAWMNRSSCYVYYTDIQVSRVSGSQLFKIDIEFEEWA